MERTLTRPNTFATVRVSTTHRFVDNIVQGVDVQRDLEVRSEVTMYSLQEKGTRQRRELVITATVETPFPGGS